MLVSSNSDTSFGAKISPKLLRKLDLQAALSLKSIQKSFEQQKINVAKWGNETDEVVIGKTNRWENDCLALKSKILKGFYAQWNFEKANGHSLLSKFLRLRECDFVETENRIVNMYKKYGYEKVKANDI